VLPFPDRRVKLIEGLARFTWLPLHFRLLKLQGGEPDEERLKKLYAVRKIYIQVFAALTGGSALVVLIPG